MPRRIAALWAAAALAAASVAFASASAAPPQKRRAVQWLVPYANSTVADYQRFWAQLADNHRPGQNLYAASAYALKANNASLGYATTPAGEAYFGLEMEQFGMPALRALGLGGSMIGMVYVTHSDAIARMLADPSAFIAELVAKAREQSLAGFDVDYEPQGVEAAERANAARGVRGAASFMQFLEQLAAALKADGRLLTIDISGCPSSFGFVCSAASNASSLPGLALVNCEDSFGAMSLEDIKQLQQSDGVASALGPRWASGWEPGNVGQADFAAAMAYLGSTDACAAAGGVCVTAISTWAHQEWNNGAQPQWLFDAINSFLDSPLQS